MKKIFLPLMALVAGFVSAFITTGVHSLFFVLLPIVAFAFGYLSSWRRGILCGFLLFISYTLAISLMWWGGDSPNLLYPLPYITAFIAGGFSLLLIGALAPKARKGFRKFGSIVALVVLSGVVSWCGYSAVTRYGCYYQVVINSSVNLENVDLYLPVGAISGEPHEELYNHVYRVPGKLTENFAQEFVDTEYGPMLKLTIGDLRKDEVPEPRFTGNIIFWQNNAPRRLIQLTPRYNVIPHNTVEWQRSLGPIKTAESMIIERFHVPIKITSGTKAQIKLTLWNRTDRGESVNFTYSRSDSYTERISYDMQTGNEWVFIPVEVTRLMEIRGISD